jgi:L-threo-3-deoxy-hexylosonate aldolase
MVYDSVYVTGGIDLDSRLIENLARRSSNSCGVKLTCPSLGKMTRLTDAIHSKPFTQQHPRRHVEAPYVG